MAYNIKDYEQVSVSTDAILLAYDESEGLKAIVMRRPSTEEFFPNSLTLIGGFTHKGNYFIDECIDTLERKINLKLNPEQLYEQHVISTPNRDPRGWIVSVPYISYLDSEQYAKLDKSKVVIVDVTITDTITLTLDGNKLTENDFGFDHYTILMDTIAELIKSTEWSLRFTQLLGKAFTLKSAHKLYTLLNPDNTVLINNFKRKFKLLLEETQLVSKDKNQELKQNFIQLKPFIK